MKKSLLFLIIWNALLLSFCQAEMISVSGSVVNVRSGPGKNHPVLWQLYSGCPLKVIKKSGNWIKAVDYEGDTGWLHQSLLSKKNSLIVLSRKARVVQNRVNVRSGPGKKHGVLFRLGKNENLKLLWREGEWARIMTSKGKPGWIHNSLLKMSNPDKVNVRSGPGTGHDIAFQAEKGVILDYQSRKGSWLRVKHGTQYEGWIHEDLVWGIDP